MVKVFVHQYFIEIYFLKKSVGPFHQKIKTIKEQKRGLHIGSKT